MTPALDFSDHPLSHCQQRMSSNDMMGLAKFGLANTIYGAEDLDWKVAEKLKIEVAQCKNAIRFVTVSKFNPKNPEK